MSLRRRLSPEQPGMYAPDYDAIYIPSIEPSTPIKESDFSPEDTDESFRRADEYLKSPEGRARYTEVDELLRVNVTKLLKNIVTQE